MNTIRNIRMLRAAAIGGGAVTLIFQQVGGTYSVDVTCYGTGNSAGYSPVVY